MIWLLSFILSTAVAKTHKSAPAKPFPSKVHMTKVGSCATPNADKKVYIFKQWHLAPTTITKGFKEKYPQEKNQTAIYQVLEEGTKRKELQLIVSEGCEGPLNADFKTAFNGWDYSALKAQAQQRGYDKIITLAPLKVVAKYGDKVPVFCGDNDSLIQEGNLRLSNLRGWMGFYVRLNEPTNDPEKSRLYSDAAADLLKIPKTTPHDQMMTQIKGQIKEELTAFRKSLNDRNDSFVKVLQQHDFGKAALVIGGLHADDLKDKLEKAGIGCEILEPPGYQHESETLIQDFQKALN